MRILKKSIASTLALTMMCSNLMSTLSCAVEVENKVGVESRVKNDEEIISENTNNLIAGDRKEQVKRSIDFVQFTSKSESGKISSKGEEIEINLYVNNIGKDELGVRVLIGEKQVDIGNIIIKSNVRGTKLTVKANIPENYSNDEKQYKFEFSKDKTFKEINKTLVVSQLGNEDNQIKDIEIDTFTASKTVLSDEDRETNFIVKGKNLNQNKVSLKILKDSKDITTEILKDKKFVGPDTGEILTLKIIFPEMLNSEGDNYKVVLVVNGEEKNSVNISVIKNGTKGELQDLQFKNTYIEGEKIVLESRTPINEVLKNSLKNNIKISINNNGANLDPNNNQDSSGIFGYEKLKTDDKVDIVEQNIVIKLSEENLKKMKASSMILIKINQNTLKNNENNPYKEASAIVYNDNKSIVEKSEIIKGKILDSKGGEVEIKLSGLNLKPYNKNSETSGFSGTKAVVYKNEKITKNDKSIEATVEGEGNEQVIKFNLPENKTNRTETYSVRISLDGGLTYSSELGNDVKDRTKRLVLAVLPEGKTKDDQTLSFMSIQSYGTSGGGEDVPDNTHTNAPTNQASKKTYVTVYGTNLDEKKTKVRIIDENGVIWTPVNEPSNDSSDRFIMVGFNGTGIEGNGNNQMIEVIMPRGYAKTNDGRDNKFTYQIAIDGVHFDQEVTVTATVLDDGSQGRKPLTDFVREVSLNYETSDGKKVSETRNVKLMSNQPLYATEAMPIEVDGYKYIGIKGFEHSPEINKKLEDIRKKKEELSLKKKLNEEEQNELKVIIKLIEGYKNDELIQAVGERKEITFLYEKENSNTQEEKSIGDKNSSGSRHSSSSKTSDSLKYEDKKINNFERILGSDRYKTSIAISKNATEKSENIILVSGDNFADALTSAALTKDGKSSILLINEKNIDSVSDEIVRLGAKEITVVGGNVISGNGLERIKLKTSANINKIAGENRYETSIKAAEKVIEKFGNKGKVILVDGRNYPDALSISPYASKEGIPVILVNNGHMTDSAKKLIKKYNIEEALIVGGEKSVPKFVESEFKNVERIAGSDRYDTSIKIAEKYFDSSKTIFIATGENYSDSLSSGYYAAKENSPVLLTKTSELNNSTKDYLNKNSNKRIKVIGGKDSVSESLFKN